MNIVEAASRGLMLTDREMEKLKPLKDAGYEDRLSKDAELKNFRSTQIFVGKKNDPSYAMARSGRAIKYEEIVKRIIREWAKTDKKVPVSFAEKVFDQAKVDKVAFPEEHDQWIDAIRRVIEITNEVIGETQKKSGKEESMQNLRRRGYIEEADNSKVADRIDRKMAMLEAQVRDMKSALEKFKKDPERYKPQLINLSQNAVAVASLASVISRIAAQEGK